jgi:pyruvate/2-oxoglutarate dehydrogenase complex dihydrolipoamide dehydrogenase (E3) component
MKQYDAIIIGSGQAGVPLAKKLAEAGKKTAIIEKRWVGGTCVNDGCTPTKTMIASAKMAYMAANSAAFGVNINSCSIDMVAIKDRKDKIVLQSRDNNEKGIERTKNLDLIYGEAVFTDKKVISVKLNSGGSQTLSADLIFINTGAKPAVPEIKGLNEIDYLDSTSIMDLDHVPEHLLVIGGNYIGLEFGQMFRRFGSQVTILEKSARIIAKEDEDVSGALTKILKDEGITILTEVNVTGFEKQKDGKIIATANVNDTDKKITCSHVLVATGRIPQSDILDLEKTGVKTDEHKYIIVNDKLETGIEGIYALGDVKGGPAFTHISYNDYTIVFRNLLEKQNLSIKDRPVPYCMFTDPQLGRIGLNETEAKKKGINYKIAGIPMANVSRAQETGDTRGFMKALVDPATKKILGASVLGQEGGEIMTMLQMAMQGGLTYEDLHYFIFAHPLYAESLNNLFSEIK